MCLALLWWSQENLISIAEKRMTPSSRSTGRPTSLTPDKEARILKAIATGMTYRLAAQYAGIDASTFYEWMRRGATEEEPFFQFSLKVRQAEADGALLNMKCIESAAINGTWQAAAWVLERRHPHEYGRTVQEHVQKVDWGELSDAQIQRLAAGEPLEKVLKG